MRLKRPEVRSELRRPHSPIGRGSGLKIRTVSVRVRLGALGRAWYREACHRRSGRSDVCGPAATPIPRQRCEQ